MHSKTPLSPRPRLHPLHKLIALVLLMLSLLMLGIGIDLRHTTQEIRAQSQHLADVIALQFDGDTARFTQLLDLVEARLTTEPTSPLHTQGCDARWEAELAQLIEHFRGVYAINYFDAQGQLLCSTQGQYSVTVQDRSHFIHLRDHATHHDGFTRPMQARTGDQEVVGQLRRLETPDGEFIGMLSLLTRLDYWRGQLALHEWQQPAQVYVLLDLINDQPEQLAALPLGRRGQAQTPPAWLAWSYQLISWPVLQSHWVAVLTSESALPHAPLRIQVHLEPEGILYNWAGNALAALFMALLIMLAALISYRKIQRSEEDARRLNTELERHQRLLSDGEALALIGGWEYQVATQKMYWTEGLYRLHDFTPDPEFDHIGQSLCCYRPEDQPRIQRAFQRCIEQGEAYDLTVPFTTYSGRTCWIRTKTAPLVESGRVVKVVGLVMDITEQKKAELHLQQALHQAEAANQAKSRFLSTITHELRTPMNAILGMAQLLRDIRPDHPQYADYVQTLLRSGQSLLRLLNDLLDLSKIEAGGLTLDLSEFVPAELLTETQQLYGPLAAQKGLDFTIHWWSDPALLLQGDGYRVRQMLHNLVNNALKFTSNGRIRCQGGLDEQGRLVFQVEDTGMGISADQQQRLFQPFTQLDDSMTRQFGGTGLGLSIVKRLCDLMQGQVTVHSQLGEGACFSLILPLKLLPGTREAASCTPTSIEADASALSLKTEHQARLPAEQLIAQISQLQQVLAEGHFDALELAQELELALQSTPWQTDYRAVYQWIHNFDFEAAQTALQRLLDHIRASHPVPPGEETACHCDT
ncbi:ATP-binding protein [Marinospirillum sp. MEB164]|uniref:histidine kinase n=1 Tax=Marinospirillum alkalitolerans TaxID=3123374 RepID=A0ABW8PXQ8_9GAMM